MNTDSTNNPIMAADQTIAGPEQQGLEKTARSAAARVMKSFKVFLRKLSSKLFALVSKADSELHL